MKEDFVLWNVTLPDKRRFGLTTRGDTVVAAPPTAAWAIGKRFATVLVYYQKQKLARVERVDLAALDRVAAPVTQQTQATQTEGNNMAKKKAAAAPKKKVAKSANVTTAAPVQATLPGTDEIPSTVTGTFGDAGTAAVPPLGAPLPAATTAPKSRPFVTRLVGNLQGGFDRPLGRFTLIVGPNASHKSTVTRGLELALEGIASDIRGRASVAVERELLRLSNGKALTVEATLSNGLFARYAIGEGGGKKGILTAPAAWNGQVNPLRAVREALLGAPDTARRYFLRFAVGNLSLEDVRSRISATHHPRLKAVGLTDDTLDVVDGLIKAIDEAGKLARGEAKKAGVVETVVDAQANALPPEPTQDQMEKARAAFTLAQRYHTIAALNVSFADTQAKLATQQQERAHLASEVARIEASLGSALPTNGQQGMTELSVLGTLEALVQSGGTVCWCCGSADVPPAEFLRRRDGLSQAMQQTIQQNQQVGQQRAWVQQAKNRIEVLDGMIAQAGAQVGEVTAAAREWNGLPTVEWAKTEYDRTQAELAALERAGAAWKVVHNTQKQGASAESLADVWKGLQKELKKVAADLLDGGVEAFRARVQRYLPASDRFMIHVDDKTVEIGLADALAEEADLHGADMGMNTALSGAEGVRVCLAIAAAVSEKVPSDVPVFMVPEDRGFDPATLEATMRALMSFDGQVLLATPTRPRHVPDGWTVIETGTVTTTATMIPVEVIVDDKRAKNGHATRPA